ncbi:MAG: hypothetical protein SGI74_02270 [Oligoflexia bacterium]|nr:hypothetical protein [Oligoflexia bacterium]
MDELLGSRRSSVLAALVSQNMTLKIALLIAGAILVVETITLAVVATKKPLVVGLTKSGPEVLSFADQDEISAPQVKSFLFDLLSRKFPPNPTADKLLKVCPLFAEGLKVSCEKEIKDKKSVIPQDFLVRELVWNDRSQTAVIQLKRYASFSGSITAVESVLSIKLQQRNRTNENPWGLFVESWKEEIQK